MSFLDRTWGIGISKLGIPLLEHSSFDFLELHCLVLYITFFIINFIIILFDFVLKYGVQTSLVNNSVLNFG